MEDSFLTGWGEEDGLGMIQACYIYCARYLYYHYNRSTSDHQALGLGDCGPLPALQHANTYSLNSVTPQ